MEAIIERCCGLDVHKEIVVACVLVGEANKRAKKESRSFTTTTRDLNALAEWLVSLGVTHVAMEATGIYWRPVHAVLEDRFQVVIGNAHHIKAVPGRKTDVKDSEWIAMLLRHGLIRASFVPPKAIRELRDLVRYRGKTTHARSAERNRIQRLLETANIKLTCVASDAFGVSGMAILKALVEGKDSPKQMANLAKRSLRKKLARLEEALEGKFEEHHRFMLKCQLEQLEHFDALLSKIDACIEERIAPYKDLRDRYCEIPGVDQTLANAMIAELGADMSVFTSVRHLAAWAGVAPGNNESAGKQGATRARRGNVYLTTALVEAAHGASRTKHSYFRDKYFRLKARRGAKRAAVAVAHKILVAVWNIASTGAHYRELGDAYLDKRDERAVARNLVRRLERLGYAVSLEALPPPKTLDETTSIISLA